jgi:NAD(P)-dependent dehydrogenase (short-subunit alcohol dehydrogenase family)
MGRGTTEALARLGWTVLMICRDRDAGAEVEEELRRAGMDVTLYVADIGFVPEVESLCEEVTSEFERLDVLVNNAGVNLDGVDATIEDMELEAFEETMAVNVRGPLWLCKKFLPLLRNSDSGRIVNVSSGLGRLTVDRSGGHPAYSISKTALNGLTKVLATELAGTQIIVNAVDPGWVGTDMGGPKAPLSIEEGIDTTVWLATAAADKLQSGCLYCRRNVITW